MKLRLDTVVWLLIYGGMILMGLGLSLRHDDGAAGWAVASAGACLTVVGVVLIGVRSRMQHET